MADIFISYSMPDRGKVVMLAAYLESEGWSVWWDNKLAAGDAFRDDIARELNAARAVIVIWTQTSVRSDFVRAEAGRAKADGKLIPVKEREVAYSDIPLPFGEMHTEDIANYELVRAAVLTQLAKPAPQPKMLQTLRYQALTWIGIVGGAVTLFTNLSGILNLADWASWLVTHWHEWTAAFWQWCFSLINVRIPQFWTGILSFVSFGTMIAISQRMIAARAQKRAPNLTQDIPALPLRSLRTLIAGLILFFASLPGLIIAVLVSLLVLPLIDLGWLLEIWPKDLLLVFFVSLFLAPWMFINLLVLVFAVPVGHRIKVAFVVFLSSLFFGIIWMPSLTPFATTLTTLPRELTPEQVVHELQEQGIMAWIQICGLYPWVIQGMLIAAPIRSLSQRLSFLALGVLLLVALNQLSHYAPDIREWLKPPVSS